MPQLHHDDLGPLSNYVKPIIQYVNYVRMLLRILEMGGSTIPNFCQINPSFYSVQAWLWSLDLFLFSYFQIGKGKIWQIFFKEIVFIWFTTLINYCMKHSCTFYDLLYSVQLFNYSWYLCNFIYNLYFVVLCFVFNLSVNFAC